MRPLFFIAEFHRAYGAQRSCLQLVRSLQTAGHRPAVMFPGDGVCTELFRRSGVETHVLEGPPIAKRFGQNLLRESRLRKASYLLTQTLPYSAQVAQHARRLEADVLHCNTPRSMFLAAPCARAIGMPVVLHLRGLSTPFSRVQRYVFSSIASRMILVANAIRDDLEPRFWNKCRTIYNAVDDASLATPPGAASPELDRIRSLGRPIVLAVGALVPAKGQHHLVEAVRLLNARLGSKRPEVVLLGSEVHEAYSRHLKQQARAAGLSNVHFVGFSDVPALWYRASDVVVLASVVRETVHTAEGPIEARSGEGLPRTILEAMYLGKPVVATAVAGVPEMIVDGETGRTAPPGNPGALADAIATMLEQPEAARAMGEKAAKRARTQFTAQVLVDSCLDVYRELAPRSAASAR